jgi:hypothetical protein
MDALRYRLEVFTAVDVDDDCHVTILLVGLSWLALLVGYNLAVFVQMDLLGKSFSDVKAFTEFQSNLALCNIKKGNEFSVEVDVHLITVLRQGD